MRIDAITVGERRREDYGDIAGLAASIQKYGLLHPIVVDEAGALVAGGRRLQAVKSLGWTDVPVRSLGELTDAERDEIELEENLQRKDLTATERSKTVAKLAETAAHIIKAEQEVFVDSAKTQGGRPPKNDVPLREVAERIGVPEATIRAAQKHVEIAEAIPVLAGPDVKQYHALEAREKLERIPEPDRPKVVALVNQPGVPPKNAIEIIGNLAAMPAPERERVLTLAESDDHRDRSLAVTEQPEYLTVEEFCALLRLPRSSVYEAISGGRLDHRRVGRSIRIHRDAGFVQASPTKRPAQRRRALVIVRRASTKKAV